MTPTDASDAYRDILNTLCDLVDNPYEKAFIESLLIHEDEHGCVQLTEKQQKVIQEIRKRFVI